MGKFHYKRTVISAVIVAASIYAISKGSFSINIKDVDREVIQTVSDTTSYAKEKAIEVIDTVELGQNLYETNASSEETAEVAKETKNFDLSSIPEFHNTPYIEINNNQPFFTDEDKQRIDAFEQYSELDNFGRCGVAYANICKNLMPEEDEERGSIGMIKPSGWHQNKYPSLIEGAGYVVNRCHLIAWCLASENDNPKNLITGTRYMNVEGMLPFETKVAKYVEETDNHVLYRATPIFNEDELMARGVLLEAYSVEDNGEGISFCIYCYNNQPGITFNYATGENQLDGE